MTPSRPYMVRAIYEWLNDNDLTPYVLVDAGKSGVTVPTAYVKDQRIVLNIAQGAVRDLMIRNDALGFSARFGGVAMDVYVPMSAVLAIYARENGQGMFFDEDEDFSGSSIVENSAPQPEPSPTKPGSGRPSLKLVK